MTTAYMHDPVLLEHDTGWSHPESAERLRHIHSQISSSSYFKNLVIIKPHLTDLNHIKLIHDPKYIKRVKHDIEEGNPYLDSGDTTVCSHSYQAALHAVGGCLSMCDAIMSKKASNGFSSVRPPGHHAEYDHAAGFCIFNNCAIAARYLQIHHRIDKVAIVDWDVHHGNGTQNSFYNDNTILYISLHQYPHYPGTGAAYERGSGPGKGYTLNIPMKTGSGDLEYLNAFEKTIEPTLNEYKPSFILISAGFDAHRSDPLSDIRLTTEAYKKFTEILMRAAAEHSENRLLAILEGGYAISAFSNSVDVMMATLTGF